MLTRSHASRASSSRSICAAIFLATSLSRAIFCQPSLSKERYLGGKFQSMLLRRGLTSLPESNGREGPPCPLGSPSRRLEGSFRDLPRSPKAIDLWVL